MQKRSTLFSSALAIACAVLSLTGCRKDLIEPNPVDSVGPIGGGNTVTLDLPVSETDGFVNVTTKSVISENSSLSSYEEGLQKLEALEGKYSDVTVFQFDSGNKLVATYYQIFPEGNGGGIYVKSMSGIKDEEYTFWAVANAGDLSEFVSTGDDVSKMADLVLEMPSVETNLVQYWEKGFPKVAKTELTTIDSSNPKFKLKFDRLVARVLFSLTTNLKYGSFEVTSLAVRQCNSKVYPFGTSKAVNVEDVMVGEMTSQIDLEALNSNDGSMYAYFYVPENMQGVPASLEGNTNPKNKNAQTIGEPLASLSTYLELTGVYTEGSGQLQTENHYRAYLGQNATNNLDVQRNTSTRFALSLKDDSSVLKGDWSADRNYDPSMDQRNLVISPDPLQVSYEVGRVFTVYSNGVRYNKYCKYALSQNLIDAGVIIDGYVLRQTRELDTDVEGTLTATSWDGVKTATATVTALKYAPSIIITEEPAMESTRLERMSMRMTAPVQTKTLYPKVTLSDGTKATITKLETPTSETLSDGNTSYSRSRAIGSSQVSDNFYYTVEVTAGKEGEATVHNTCDLTVEYNDTEWASNDNEPKTVKKSKRIQAANDVALTVDEDRVITFSEATETLQTNYSGSALVTSNFNGTVDFSILNGVEGFSITKLDGNTNLQSYEVPFTAGEPVSIEYTYEGTEEKTVSIKALLQDEYTVIQGVQDVTLVPKYVASFDMKLYVRTGPDVSYWTENYSPKPYDSYNGYFLQYQKDVGIYPFFIAPKAKWNDGTALTYNEIRERYSYKTENSKILVVNGSSSQYLITYNGNLINSSSCSDFDDIVKRTLTIYAKSKYPADDVGSAVLHFVDIEDRCLGRYDVLYKIGDSGRWCSAEVGDEMKRTADIPQAGGKVYFKCYHPISYEAFGMQLTSYGALLYWYNPPVAYGYSGGYDYCSYDVPANNTGNWRELYMGIYINSSVTGDKRTLFIEQRP